MKLSRLLQSTAAAVIIATTTVAGTALADDSPSADTDPVLPYPTFYDVPQLGREPVRGSGCGADGSIGDRIPDGIWAGFIDEIEGFLAEIDLLCVFTPQAASGVLAGGTATFVTTDPNYLVVNNNERIRYTQ